MRSLLLALGFFLAVPAWAEAPDDSIRNLLRTVDPAGVEEGIGRLREKAVADDSVADFWLGFSAAFTTTDPVKLRAVAAWRKAMPNSALAKAGEAVARAHLAWLTRGENTFSGTRPERLTQFKIDLEIAGKLATEAIEDDPAIVPAYRVVFGAQRAGLIPKNPEPFLEMLLEHRNTAYSLIEAARVYHPRWGGSPEALFKLCDAYARRIPDYDLEACAIDVVYDFDLGGSYQEAAHEALTKRSDARFDIWRFKELLRTPIYQGSQMSQDADWALDYHRNALSSANDVSEWLDQARSLQHRINIPFYLLEAEDLAIAEFEHRIAESPYDAELIAAYIPTQMPQRPGEELDAERREELFALWRKTLIFGSDDVQIWTLGSYLAGGHTDVEARYPFLINSIILQNHSVPSLAVAMNQFGDLDANIRERMTTNDPALVNGDEILATLGCPVARLARLYEAACRADPNWGQLCDPAHTTYQHVPATLRRLKAGTICPEVADLPLSSLPFAEWIEIPGIADEIAAYQRWLD